MGSLCRDGGSKKARRSRWVVYKPLMRLACRCHHLWEMRAASETRLIELGMQQVHMQTPAIFPADCS